MVGGALAGANNEQWRRGCGYQRLYEGSLCSRRAWPPPKGAVAEAPSRNRSVFVWCRMGRCSEVLVLPRFPSPKAAEWEICICRDVPFNGAHPVGRHRFVRLRGDWRGRQLRGRRGKGGKEEGKQKITGLRVEPGRAGRRRLRFSSDLSAVPWGYSNKEGRPCWLSIREPGA